MEFGKADIDINSIDFTLPPDPVETTRLLQKQKSENIKPEFFVGCAKWGRKDWVGKIYPPGTKEADFLSLYAQHFNCIELNASFYRLPTLSQTSGWASKVGKDFKFSPKFTDKISHLKRLKDAQELTDRFLKGISGFRDNLGPVFLMPHPGMGSKTLETIEAFIQSLPKEIDLFVELRNPQWFSDPETFDRVFSMLERNNTGSVITDASGRRDCVHMRLTRPTAFIRFVGNDLHPTDFTRVDAWIQRIKKWVEQGLEKIYFFMHQNEEINSPEMCKYVIEQLNKHCNANMRALRFEQATPSEPAAKVKRAKKE